MKMVKNDDDYADIIHENLYFVILEGQHGC